MVDREEIRRKAREAFEERWRHGDPWGVQGSELDSASYRFQLSLLAGRCYARALEIGCGAGVFTQLLAGIADRVVAVDVAPSAVERAAAATPPGAEIEYLAADIMELDVRAGGPWDLIVMSETIYCLGWLYPLFDVGVLASELHAAASPGGRFLMANTYGGEQDWLLKPWLIDTYRDLFANVGWRLEREELLRGSKNGVDLDILVSLFEKP